MKNYKKLWLFLIVFSFMFALIGCQVGGDKPGPGPGTDPNDDTKVKCSENMDQEKCYDPKTFDWELNRSKFDGKKMTIQINVLPLSEHDPFDNDFKSTRKTELQEHQTSVESAYNVTIKYKAYPEDAPWGPTRVQWISDAFTAKIADRGHIFLIDTNWISTLVTTNSLAELQNSRNNKGYYSDLIKFKQSDSYVKMASVNSKIYAYLTGDARPDHFLYYNQDLIDEYGFADPATLWNEGKWDWTAFTNLLETAQNKFSTSEKTMYPLAGVYAEFVQGLVSARGGMFIDFARGQAMMTNPTVVQAFTDLQELYKRDFIEENSSSDANKEFQTGNALITSGELWFVKSDMRFGTNCNFRISAVPYPTANGDAESKASFKVPLGFSAGFAISPITNGENGLNSGILLNILDDLSRGLKPETVITGATSAIRYQKWLEDRFETEATVEAIMSVQNSKFHQLELLQTVSMKVGHGSHYTGDAFYPFAGTLVKNTSGELSPQAELTRIQPFYQTALEFVLGKQ